MKYRVIAALLLFALLGSMTLLGAPKKPPAPTLVAPETLAHPNAMFLASLSKAGTRRVTFKAAADGTRFFIEESTGVTVYVYDGHDYRRDKFLKQSTLEKAMKAYAKKR